MREATTSSSCTTSPAHHRGQHTPTLSHEHNEWTLVKYDKVVSWLLLLQCQWWVASSTTAAAALALQDGLWTCKENSIWCMQLQLPWSMHVRRQDVLAASAVSIQA
jgi:hypothetical protein